MKNGQMTSIAAVMAFAVLCWFARGALCYDPAPIWKGTGELFGSDVEPRCVFGVAIALSEDTCIVGDAADDEDAYRSGAAYVYERKDGEWAEVQKLLAPDVEEDDQFGAVIALDGDVAMITSNWADDEYGSSVGAVYVFRLVDGSWEFEQKLVGSELTTHAMFGRCIGLSGNMALIGAPLAQEMFTTNVGGVVYVYEYDGTEWSETGKFTSSDNNEIDLFGSAICLSGDLALIGAPNGDSDAQVNTGAAYVFAKIDGDWVEQQKLNSWQGALSSNFGSSLAASEDFLFVGDVGDYGAGNSGAVFVFQLDGEDWVQEQQLSGSSASSNNLFGSCIAVLDGDLFVGAPAVDGDLENSGAVHLFTYDGDEWSESQRLGVDFEVASNAVGSSIAVRGNTALVGATGILFHEDFTGRVYEFRKIIDCNDNDIDDADDIAAQTSQDCDANGVPDECFDPSYAAVIEGSDAEPAFGNAVSLSSGIAVIGAPLDDELGSSAGAAYVLRFEGGGWVEEQKLLASNGAVGDLFGCSVAVKDNTILIGAMHERTEGTAAGAAYVFRYESEQWVEVQKLTAESTSAGDEFGRSVALWDDTAMVGAPLDDAEGTNSGAVYVFSFDGTSWSETQLLTTVSLGSGDNLGSSLAIYSDLLLTGAPGSDSVATNAGCVFAFQKHGDEWLEHARMLVEEATEGDGVGAAISLACRRAVIGVPLRDGARQDTGAVYLFDYDVDGWLDPQVLTPPEAYSGFRFGASVALSDDMLAVGAPLDGPFRGGAVHVFRNVGGASPWEPWYRLDAFDGVEAVEFGSALAIDGTDLAVSGELLDAPGEVANHRALYLARDLDCNQNGILDRCDIANGDELDADGNGTLDGCASGAPCEYVDLPRFKRGDVNGNGVVQPLADTIFALKWRFTGGDAPPCMDAADVNGDNAVTGFGDIFYLLYWGLASGPSPPAPGAAECGADPDGDTGLDCASSPLICR